MRRTQNVSSYIAMTVILVFGVAFMVFIITQMWFRQFIFDILSGLATLNLAVFAGIAAILLLVAFYLLLRHRFTV